MGRKAVILGMALGLFAVSVSAADIPPAKQTPLGLYVNAKEAYATKKEDPTVLFVDVRSHAEVNFLGMPTVADANIPYMELPETPDWNEKDSTFRLEANSAFVLRIDQLIARKGLSKEARIILMCRSGDRSAAATKLLAEAGYTHVYSVTDGFEGDKVAEGPNAGKRVVNGWKNADLPWSYKLDRSKIEPGV